MQSFNYFFGQWKSEVTEPGIYWHFDPEFEEDDPTVVAIDEHGSIFVIGFEGDYHVRDYGGLYLGPIQKPKRPK